MNTYTESTELNTILSVAQNIVVLQADNPDADSLASALALEEILSEMGKNVSLYCSMDMPNYLRYLQGWDRIQNELPRSFDAAILVDASTTTLLTKLEDATFKSALVNKPFVILDHHAIVQNEFSFANLSIVDGNRASTGELIYLLAIQLNLPITVTAAEFIMTSILGDTQGLTNDLTSSQTYRIMAELVDIGVNRSHLEELRRESNKMVEQIFKYKAELISRTQLYQEGTIGVVDVPQQEINQYSPLYNPAPLVQNDMLQIDTLLVSIVFKVYDSGRITAAIRANSNAPIANTIAGHFGGGGHTYASGFKIEDGRSFNEVKSECIAFTSALIKDLNKE